jgi:hypothetical protein
MKRVPPAKLSTCIVTYYVALVLVGTVGSILEPPGVDHSVVTALSGGLWILFLTHVFFALAISIQGDWLSYLMVVGIPIAIIVSTMKLHGWPRNAVVVVLLFSAHAYGLAVASMNG